MKSDISKLFFFYTLTSIYFEKYNSKNLSSPFISVKLTIHKLDRLQKIPIQIAFVKVSSAQIRHGYCKLSSASCSTVPGTVPRLHVIICHEKIPRYLYFSFYNFVRHSVISFHGVSQRNKPRKIVFHRISRCKLVVQIIPLLFLLFKLILQFLVIILIIFNILSLKNFINYSTFSLCLFSKFIYY